MLENMFTTKMSTDKTKLLRRFIKIHKGNIKSSRLLLSIFSLLIFMAMLYSFVVMAAFYGFDKYDIKLYYNDELVRYKNSPFFLQNSVYIPLRETMNVLGFDNDAVKWSREEVLIYAENECYKIKTGDSAIYLVMEAGAEERALLEFNAPVLLDSVTYVPFEYINYFVNRNESKYDLRYTFGDIDSEAAYLDNAEFYSFYHIQYLQFNVDNGHFPWRLDARQTARSYVNRFGTMNDGEFGDFQINGSECTTVYKFDGRAYNMKLIKPAKQDNYGIWIVKEFYNAKADFSDKEIEAAKAVVKKYIDSMASRDKQGVLSTLTPEYDTPTARFWQEEITSLKSIELDKTDSLKNSYIAWSRAAGQEIEWGNVIMFYADLYIDVYGESTYTGGDYDGYAFLLVRENKSSPWRIDLMGYHNS